MFIELTDHLCCTAPHDESFLVLLPGRMDGRLVVEGVLGCPVCQREVPVHEGVADFGGGTPAAGPTGLAAEAAHALLGLEGPGGYLLLVGAAGSLAGGLAALLPGIRGVAVNPEAGMGDSPVASVLRADRLPVRRASMRGAVISRDHAGDPEWLAATIGAVLPGLRVVAEGPVTGLPGIEILAEAGGWWVGRRSR